MVRQMVTNVMPKIIKDGLTCCRNCSEFRVKYSWTIFVLSTLFFTGFNTWFVSTGGLKVLFREYVSPLLCANLIFYTTTLVSNVLWLTGTAKEETPRYAEHNRRINSCKDHSCEGRNISYNSSSDNNKLPVRQAHKYLVHSSVPNLSSRHQYISTNRRKSCLQNNYQNSSDRFPLLSSQPSQHTSHAKPQVHGARPNCSRLDDITPGQRLVESSIIDENERCESTESLLVDGVNARLPDSLCRLVASDPQRLNTIVDFVTKSKKPIDKAKLSCDERCFAENLTKASDGCNGLKCNHETSNNKIRKTVALNGITKTNLDKTHSNMNLVSKSNEHSSNFQDMKSEPGTSRQMTTPRKSRWPLRTDVRRRSNSDSKLNIRKRAFPVSDIAETQTKEIAESNSTNGRKTVTFAASTENDVPHTVVSQRYSDSHVNFSSKPEASCLGNQLSSDNTKHKPSASRAVTDCCNKHTSCLSRDAVKKEFNRELKNVSSEKENNQAKDYIPMFFMKSPYRLK